MSDMISETYIVLNKYLGKEDDRKNVRLSDEYESLKKEVQNLVVKWYNVGLQHGIKNERYKIKEMLIGYLE